MNDDGTMARVPDLTEFCRRHGLKMITVADLIEHRRRMEKLVERVVSVRLPTEFGEFEAVAYRELLTDKQHVALVKGEIKGAENVLVRVHSECLTGDVSTPCSATAASSSRTRSRASPRRSAASFCT
jgi:3,4-dihydroxy 2-butanone 4-phosphate synthase / GTP cyclohydrolase II